jgi:chemotaxis family two-component system response regulator Rcp1
MNVSALRSILNCKFMAEEDRKPRVADILLVEDNEDDVILTLENFRAASSTVKLHTVENGEQCMAFLKNRHPYENAPKVDLILLDLNLPLMDGRQVVAAINADETLRHLPIVVLTASAVETDILNMYKLRCNSYIVKPVKEAEFVQSLRTLGDYWLSLPVLPTANQRH